MKASEIRQSFLDYFRERGHTIVESAPVVPQGDPTLLFTNAGMNQFKDVFLGTGQRSYSRAADTQKCIRAGGKHNDLEEVGIDGYHQTLFEMLGNWSFGDYFKRESIEWAWDLLTNVWGMNKDLLYATVHHTDDEARKLWPEVTGIPPERVLDFDDKDNFWEMGNTGPCGPCTEIHIDRGEGTCDQQHDPDHECAVNAGCARYIELWNLVFIQFERKADGSLEPLPAKHVDTGMGLERVCQVLQGKFSNYDTDLFTPLIEAIAERTGVPYDQGGAGTPHRAIADHVRCLSFAIADGATPDRTGRGYVLRRILRRASRFLHKLGVQEPALKDFVPVLAGYMGDAFPELRARQDHIVRVIEKEEAQFLKTLDRGVAHFEKELASLEAEGTKVVPGKTVFFLYDTLGFPPDLTAQMASEAGCKADLDDFRRIEEDAKEKNRKQGKFQVDLAKFKSAPVTRFSGYTHTSDHGTVAGTGERELVLDATPFYAESGGQVGDTGRIVAEDGSFEFEVHDTQKQGQVFVHMGEWLSGSHDAVKSGTPALAEVDAARRAQILRNHSATHILHWALHEVLNKTATQQGSEVSPNRLRFDFAWGERVGPDELTEIERLVNEKIVQNALVSTEEMPIDEAREKGAIAMFGEKYGEQVRVVEMGDFSLELCGGTHVARTGDIGSFKLIQEASVSEGVRRVAAVTGGTAVARSHEDTRLLGAISRELKIPPEEVLARLRKMQDEIKDLQKKNKEAMAAALPDWKTLEGQAQAIDGIKLLAVEVPGADAEALRRFGDAVQRHAEPFAGVFLAADEKGKVPVVVALSKQLVEKGWHARDFVRAVAGAMGGGGGGKKPELCSGSGKDPSKIAAALAEAEAAVKKALSS
jgi:alanyl-tRNA synthetase